ncbi:MAG: hypothetical protein ABIV94_05785 [Acidimicrobiales bacterium]
MELTNDDDSDRSTGKPAARRFAPLLGLVAIGWLLRILLRRRHR